MAAATSGRAGSWIPTTPTKVRPASTSPNRSGSERGSAETSAGRLCRTAHARQRSASLPPASSPTVANSEARSSGTIGTTAPPPNMACVQRASTDSGAPLTKSEWRPAPPPAPAPAPRRVSTLIDLRPRVNSRVARGVQRRSQAAEVRSGSSVSAAGTPRKPIFSASERSAASVGSPVWVHEPCTYRLQRRKPGLRKLRWGNERRLRGRGAGVRGWRAHRPRPPMRAAPTVAPPLKGAPRLRPFRRPSRRARRAQRGAYWRSDRSRWRGSG
mmetsp:Transcript_39097/g.123383  ORF Transcript_39097/g.123383 Transcript_39097/m.123383 type:complete len:271 (-) Transcript_39097:1201-2013(-)